VNAVGRLGLVAACVALTACSNAAKPPADAGTDATADAAEPPSWLGDAGLVQRTPSTRPLRELCGIASNPGDMPLGADATSAFLRKGYFDAALDLGGVMIRRDMRWAEMEPTKGTYDFVAHDRLTDEANARGVKLVATLGYGNPWANTSSMGDEFFPPTDPNDFARWAGAVAARYRGKVVAWEIWNEPNNGWRFWKTALSGDPAAYGALLDATSKAMHAADPQARVMFGGTVFTPQLIEGAMPWLEKAYASKPDLAASFDLMGLHTYMAYPPERAPEDGVLLDAPVEAKVQMHAWLLDRHGAGSKGMWITELGWPVSGKVDQAAQARYTVRATLLAARAGAEGIFWYTLRDGPNPAAFPPEDAFGLLGNDQVPAASKEATPKLVYRALKAMLALAGQRHVTLDDPRVRDLPADGRAVRLHADGMSDVIAVWTVSAAARARFEASADVYDQLGTKRGATDAGGGFDAGPDVTYLVAR
jgi:hypothetical protein